MFLEKKITSETWTVGGGEALVAWCAGRPWLAACALATVPRREPRGGAASAVCGLPSAQAPSRPAQQYCSQQPRHGGRMQYWLAG